MRTKFNESSVGKLSDEEACRRLMEFLHGDDAEEMTEALLKHGTDEVIDSSMTPEIEASFAAFIDDMSHEKNRSNEIALLEKQKVFLLERLQTFCQSAILQAKVILIPNRVAVTVISAICIALIVAAIAWPVSPVSYEVAGPKMLAEGAQREDKLPSGTVSGGLNTLTFHAWSNDDAVTAKANVTPSPDSNLSLEVDASGVATGTVRSVDGKLSWQIGGFVNAGEIVLARRSGSQNEHSGTSTIRVTKQPNSETYLGYILGKNCVTKEVVVCPYMLTTGQEGDAIRWSEKFGPKAVCTIIEKPEVVCG